MALQMTYKSFYFLLKDTTDQSLYDKKFNINFTLIITIDAIQYFNSQYLFVKYSGHIVQIE